MKNNNLVINRKPKNIINKILIILLLNTLFACKGQSNNNIETTVENKAVENKKINDLDSLQRYVYITFDDGPNNGTQNLINIINEVKIPITSFIVGQHINGSSKQKKLFQELVENPNIEIANHSYTHAHKVGYNRFYQNHDYLLNDFNKAKDSIKVKDKVSRTPGRNIWRLSNISFGKSSSADYLHSKGYVFVGWDSEWKGTKFKLKKSESDVIFKSIENTFANNKTKIKNHLVFLCHDQYITDSTSVNEFKKLIHELKQKNYIFRKISEYPGVNNNEIAKN